MGRMYEKCTHMMYGHTGWVYSIAVDKDGTPYSGSNDHTIRSWNTKYSVCEKVLLGHESVVSALDLFKTNKVLISGGWDALIMEWNVDPNTQTNDGPLRILKGHSDRINKIKSSGELDKFFSASNDGTVREWDTETGECTEAIRVTGSAYCLALNHKSPFTVYYGSRGGELAAIDTRTKEVVMKFRGLSSDVTACHLISDDVHLFGGAQDGSLHLFDTRMEQVKQALEHHGGPVSSLQERIDRERLSVYSAAHDGTIKEWNVANGECERMFERSALSIYCLDISRQDLAWFGGDEELVRSWNLAE